MKHLFYLFLLVTLPNNYHAQEKVLLSVYFETGSYSLSAKETKNLQDFEKSLHGKGVSSLSITGFTDDVGEAHANMELSKKRAESIKNQFSFIPFNLLESLTVEGKGEIQLSNVLKASVETQRKMNRRADIEITFDLPSPVVMEEIIEKEETPAEKGFSNRLKVGDKVVLKDVLFQGGTDYLFRESEESLDELLFFLKANPAYNITILGHVCCQYDGLDGLDRETGIRNLSVARAKKVYDILVTKGIDKKRLDYKGLKGDFPTGLGEEADRRVEVEISGISE